MKYLRIALFVFVSALGIARAQEERGAPPTEIPDFSNLDEFTYETKSTVTLGFRHLSGAKTSFSGRGKVAGVEDPGPVTGANLARDYHNGKIQPDARTTSRLDSSGNLATDPDTGKQVFDPIAPDGKTNTWSYSDARQLTPDGFVAFSTYSADIIDTDTRKIAAASTNGMELVVMRDMGKLFGTGLAWNLTAGMSVNDISSQRSDKVRATLTTLTDMYSLFGQTPPAAPYGSPSSTTVPMLDAAGNPAVDDAGVAKTVSTDATVLIGNQPAGRNILTTTDTTSVSNHWKLKGAYFTFRAGPTVWVPITSRFRASFSLGLALVYAGTNYTVTESFTPEIGSEITETNSSAASKFLPGYYADATLQFDLTERAGFYAGAIFQSAGSYDQELVSDNAHYSTKVDLANQNGLRAGMTIRF